MYSNASTLYSYIERIHSIQKSSEVSTYLRSLSDLVLTSNSCDLYFARLHIVQQQCCTLALSRSEHFGENLYFCIFVVFFLYFISHIYQCNSRSCIARQPKKIWGIFATPPPRHFLSLYLYLSFYFCIFHISTTTTLSAPYPVKQPCNAISK